MEPLLFRGITKSLSGWSVFAWPWVCRAWVIAPVAMWLPGVPPRLGLPFWFSVWSVVTVAVGLLQPWQRPVRWTGWWLLGCLWVFWIHQTQFGMASKWITTVLTLTFAVHLISERGSWAWMRQAWVWLAVLQIPVVLLQCLDIPLPYVTNGRPPWGTLGDHIDLSILWGIASLLSTGRQAWGWAILACLTGSWTGSVPALGRLFWPYRRYWWGLLPFLPGMGMAFLAHAQDRWQVLVSIPSWGVNWWTGWGFLSLPGGFGYDDALSQLIGVRDTHNVLVDWWVRGGIVAMGMTVALGSWIVHRTRQTQTWYWLAAAGWIMSWQSLEGRPLLVLAGLVWWMGLQEDAHGCVDTR